LFQRLGRGTRRSKEKEKLIAYDFIDTGHEYTESHSLFRMEELESEKEIFIDVLDKI
jgi:superfamily II DNA or RNA helicase